MKQSECYSWEPEVEKGIQKLPFDLQMKMREALNLIDAAYAETAEEEFVALGEEIAQALIKFGEE